MIERNPPEIGSVMEVTFRRVLYPNSVLRDVHEGFEFKTMNYVPDGILLPKCG